MYHQLVHSLIQDGSRPGHCGETIQGYWRNRALLQQGYVDLPME